MAVRTSARLTCSKISPRAVPVYGEIKYGPVSGLNTTATTELVLNPPGVAVLGAALITLNWNIPSIWFLGFEGDRAATVLHELGHAFDMIWGLAPPVFLTVQPGGYGRQREQRSAWRTRG